MSLLPISCPSCGFSRQVPAEKVPDGPRRVTCPHCKGIFTYTKPASPVQGEEPHPTPPPEPPAAASPVSPSSPPPPHPTGSQGSRFSRPGETASNPPRAERPRPRAPRELTDIGGLFRESWALFQRRCSTLIALFLLALVAAAVPLALSAGLAVLVAGAAGGTAFVLLLGLGAVAGLACGLWCYGGFLAAVVDDTLDLKGALARGKEMILPLAWISFLTGLIIGGGYLLLIIPGLIFTVWFFSAQLLLPAEGVRGMDALLKSREYLRGQWLNVALRLLLIWAASAVVGAIPFIGPLVAVIFFPFVVIFHYLIYRDLRAIKGDVPYSCGTGDKLLWPGVTLAGWVLVPAALFYLAGSSLPGKLGNATLVERIAKPTSEGELRVITFPPTEGIPAGASPPVGGESTSPLPDAVSSPATEDEQYPENIHVFIYAVNYTGTVTANGTTIQKLGEKPDMQYNYNLMGKGLRFGQNRIEVDFSEIPVSNSSLREIHIKISRTGPESGKAVLGDWRFSDKGAGRKVFDFEIAK